MRGLLSALLLSSSMLIASPGTSHANTTPNVQNFPDLHRLLPSTNPAQQPSIYTPFYIYNGWGVMRVKTPVTGPKLCSAVFSDNATAVFFLQPSPEADSWLVFTGKNIPKPSQTTEAVVTLIQTGGEPKTLRAVNFYAENPDQAGTIAIAAPHLKTAINGLENVHRFQIIMNNESVVDVTLHDGLIARDKVHECFEA